MSKQKHPCHHNQLKRLHRIQGQMTGIKKMIEEERYCPDILTQLKAVTSAVKSLQTEILKTHLNHCVADALKSKNKKEQENKIGELLELFKKW